MAPSRRRSREQNRAYYARRKQRAQEQGYSGYGQQRKSQPAKDVYYRQLLRGRGKIARQWREVIARDSIPRKVINNPKVQSAFGRMMNKSYHIRDKMEQRRVRAQWVRDMNLSPTDQDWLLRQLGVVSP